jgi:uncharacterized protein involved in exopolysaccharide biosynthesis
MTSEFHDLPIGAPSDATLDLLDILSLVVSRWRMLTLGAVAAGVLALGATYLITPTFTARTTFLPPQQQQSSAASALASLGALSGLTGIAVKTSGDQFVSLMQSVKLEDRLVDKFKLMDVYKSRYRFEARQALEGDVRIALGKKDGLITVEVDSTDPQRAAALANQYVVELRRLSGELALTESQERRIFFENELKRTQGKLIDAQNALQSSGFNANALKTEPKAEADGYGKIKAEATAAEVRLQAMRRNRADTAPEVQQQEGVLEALRDQLRKLEVSDGAQNSTDYVTRYREFKYEETLFELFSKQYEMARLDESRDSALIQVVDEGTVPEHKSKPKRAVIAVSAALVALIFMSMGLVGRRIWQQAKRNRRLGEKLVHSDEALRSE